MTDWEAYLDGKAPGAAPAATAADGGVDWGAYLDSKAPATPQIEGATRLPLMAASNLAKGVIEAPSALSVPFRAYDKYVGVPFSNFIKSNVLGQENPETQGMFSTPGSPTYMAGPEDFAHVGRQLGVVDRPDLKPQSTGEKYLAAGAEGVGGAVPYAAMGDLPDAGRMLGQGLAAGVGAKAVPDMWPSWLPGKDYAQVIGSALGAYGAGKGYDAGSRVVNAVANPSPTVQAYRTAGVTPALAGDVTGNPTLQKMQAATAQLPGGGRVLRAGNQAVDQFGNSVERTASGLGDSATAQEAGSALQTEARNWMQNVEPQIHQQAWAPVDAALGPKAPVALDNYRSALDDITGRVGRIGASADVLQPGAIDKLKAALGADLPAGAPATWQEAQYLRGLVGEARGNPGLIEGIGDKNLSRLYASLSDDMRGAATKAGAGDAFDTANATSTGLYNFRGNVLGKITASNNPLKETIAPEQAANTILGSGKSGDFLLNQIREQMPQAADELAAFKLRQMAQSKPGAVGDYSPVSFDTNYRALAPEARSVLFQADPSIAAKVDALKTVASSMKGTAQSLGGKSQTGPYLATKQLLETPKEAAIGAAVGGGLGSPFGLTGSVIGGTVGGALGGLGPWAPGLLGGQTLSRPWLTQLLAAQSRQTSPVAKTLGIAGTTLPKLLREPEDRKSQQ